MISNNLSSVLNTLIANGDEQAFEAFVKTELRAGLPIPYTSKVRPNWHADHRNDHEWDNDGTEFRGLHIAAPTKIDWLSSQPFAPNIVKISRYTAGTEPLRDFSNIATLNLSGSKATDYSALVSMTKLRELDLWGAHINDLTDVGRVKSLVWLQLFRTRVRDISPLEKLSNLRCLALCGAKGVTSLDPISNLKNLMSLNISATSVTDLSAITELPKLERIYLRELKLHNLKVLHEMKSLQSIDLLKTDTSKSDLAHLQEALPNVRISA